MPAPNDEAESKNEEGDVATPVHPQESLDTTTLGELLFHPSTRIFDARIAASIPADLLDGSASGCISALFDKLFLGAPSMYQSICLATPEWRKEKHFEKYGTYYSQADIHGCIFSYVLKRISCLPFIENDGYTVQNHYSSATDEPFVYFVHTLLKKARLGQAISEEADDQPSTVPSPGSTLIIDDPRAGRAFEIFTQHPMKFHVQIKKNGHWLPEEYAIVWCQDVEEAGKWDLVWEYMSKGMARIYCPETNYAF